MSRELYQAEVLANECLAADNPSVANAVELLRLLQANCHELAEDALLWTSAKLDKKLQVQLEDALSVVSATLPPWTTTLPRLCPFLLSLEARKKLLKYTAFGPSFAIHWVQEHKVGSLMQRRATVQTELNSQADPRKIQELSQELSNLEEHVVRSSNWLGTLQSTLVKVSKGDLLLRQSEVAMDLLSGSGHLLEVQFDGETGFGSAVTQSFYVEVSMALQDRELNRQIPLWVEDDGSSCTPYLLSRRGLLIRPVAEGPLREAACQRFRFLGRLMGHALRDGFIAPLPLTEDFFALVLGQRLGVKNLPEPGAGLAGELLGALAKFAEHLAVGRKQGKGDLWRQEQANLPDFTSRYLATDAGAAGIESKVEVTESSEQQLSLDDYLKLLGVSFLETGLSGASLCPGGENVPVTLDNLEEFLEQAATFWFDTGVRAQVDAFRAGLNEILPVECLAAFRPSELRQMFCGEDRVEWDEKALLKHLRPSGGLSGGSQLFSHLVAVLLEMDQANRARFLDFVSSCPRLPPGGIANFHLDVFPDPQTGSRKGFPRSRACANQLYLPPYSSKEELRERLVEALRQSKLFRFTMLDICCERGCGRQVTGHSGGAGLLGAIHSTLEALLQLIKSLKCVLIESSSTAEGPVVDEIAQLLDQCKPEELSEILASIESPAPMQPMPPTGPPPGAGRRPVPGIRAAEASLGDANVVSREEIRKLLDEHSAEVISEVRKLIPSISNGVMDTIDVATLSQALAERDHEVKALEAQLYLSEASHVKKLVGADKIRRNKDALRELRCFQEILADLHAGHFGCAPERRSAAEAAAQKWEILTTEAQSRSLMPEALFEASARVLSYVQCFGRSTSPGSSKVVISEENATTCGSSTRAPSTVLPQEETQSLATTEAISELTGFLDDARPFDAFGHTALGKTRQSNEQLCKLAAELREQMDQEYTALMASIDEIQRLMEAEVAGDAQLPSIAELQTFTASIDEATRKLHATQANAPAEVCKGSASSASSESGLLEKRRDSLDAKLEAILEIGEVYHSESILPSEPTKMCNVQLEDKDDRMLVPAAIRFERPRWADLCSDSDEADAPMPSLTSAKANSTPSLAQCIRQVGLDSVRRASPTSEAAAAVQIIQCWGKALPCF
ncbi:unnamed protein product [Effrenium voratum]|nr:unnamed protein product [Effrenium voratum]